MALAVGKALVNEIQCGSTVLRRRMRAFRSASIIARPVTNVQSARRMAQVDDAGGHRRVPAPHGRTFISWMKT